jgi:hypothetical protein
MKDWPETERSATAGAVFLIKEEYFPPGAIQISGGGSQPTEANAFIG